MEDSTITKEFVDREKDDEPVNDSYDSLDWFELTDVDDDKLSEFQKKIFGCDPDDDFDGRFKDCRYVEEPKDITLQDILYVVYNLCDEKDFVIDDGWVVMLDPDDKRWMTVFSDLLNLG